MRHNGVHFFTCQLPKADRDHQFLTLLTSKRASRHNSVHYLNISADKSAPNPRFFNMFTSKHVLRLDSLHFVNIWTSKSAPKKVCFAHFWLRNLLCLTVACTFSTAHQRCFENNLLLPFWPWNVLRATPACNFSSLIWPDGAEPAALASLLVEPQNTGKKHSVSRLSYLFAHLHLPSSDSFSSLIFFLPFPCRTLRAFAASSVHIVESLISKLPSINHHDRKKVQL